MTLLKAMKIGMKYEHLKNTRVRTKDGMFILASEKYTDNILEALGMIGCEEARTPVTTTRSEKDLEEPPLAKEDAFAYRRALGIVKFASNYRGDIGN